MEAAALSEIPSSGNYSRQLKAQELTNSLSPENSGNVRPHKEATAISMTSRPQQRTHTERSN